MVPAGEHWKKLAIALCKAFHTPGALERMVKFQFDLDLAMYAPPGGNLLQQVYALIDYFDQEGGGTERLITGARNENPGNPLLRAFEEEYCSAHPPKPANTDPLERVIVVNRKFQHIAVWNTRSAEVARRVCCIEIDARAVGTGILVGPDVVLTNHHVMADVLSHKAASPHLVGVRFDYKKLPGGDDIHPGKRYRLATDWLLDASPVSPTDLEPLATGTPLPEHLDYALLRLDGMPGSDLVDGVPRGYEALPQTPYAFVSGDTLIIVQHPHGQPLQLVIETESIVAENANQTRVAYRTNTEKCSSGSPGYNQDWQLVVLHQGEDPREPSKRNRGIPIAAIRSLIERNGKAGLLGP